MASASSREIPHVAAAVEYAEQVISKDILACKYVRQACQRFIDDLNDPREFYFDAEAAERYCRFQEKLPHTKGRWARQRLRLKLEPWQCFIWCNVFGWKRKSNDTRRFRYVYAEIPRKNGKSLMLAGFGVYMLCADGEYGAEVYCGATTQKQAWEVFQPAKKICEKLSELREFFGVEVNAASLVRIEDASKFEPVIGDPGDGPSPSAAIVDEFHEHKLTPKKDTSMHDTFDTGMGAREQPILAVITTAGVDTSGPCYQKRTEAIKALEGSVPDDELFAIIYTIDEELGEDFWQTEDALRMANPNYGVAIDPEKLRADQQRAIEHTTRQNTFKTKHLNVWVGAKNAWMNSVRWARCARPSLDIKQFHGQPCHVGLDLASKTDVAAVAIWFRPEPNQYRGFFRYYIPEEALTDGRNKNYADWHRNGWLIATPGSVIDQARIESDVLELSSQYQIESMGFDPWQATYMATRLREQGVEMVEFRQLYSTMSEPMKEWEAAILEERFHFDGCPVTTWMMSNVVADVDGKENIKPNKEHRDNKIDGAVAGIMALGRWLEAVETVNHYETRGLLIV